MKVSHKSTQVNKEFCEWYEKTYGSRANGHVKIVTGKIYDYLAMKLDYSQEGKVIINMMDYMNNMIEEFPYELESSKCKLPWKQKLFNMNRFSQKLDKTKSDTFHTFIRKCMFLGKRGRSCILIGTSFLSTRIRDSDMKLDYYHMSRKPKISD